MRRFDVERVMTFKQRKDLIGDCVMPDHVKRVLRGAVCIMHGEDLVAMVIKRAISRDAATEALNGLRSIHECVYHDLAGNEHTALLTALREADAAFAVEAPEAHQEAQKASAGIGGTVFADASVIRNAMLALHAHESTSFVAMLYLREGKVGGDAFAFPEFGVAVKLDCGDLVLMDEHHLHGTLPIDLYQRESNRHLLFLRGSAE